MGQASGPVTRAPDPVNLPMIRHWVEAMGDENPVYLDEEAAREVGATVEAREPAIRAYERFLRRVVGVAVVAEDMEGGGVHAEEARYYLTALQRAQDWEAIQNGASVASLQAFLQKYPQGVESNQARDRLAGLQAK